MQTETLIEQVQALPEADQWKIVMALLQQLQDKQPPPHLGEPMSMEAFQQRIAQAEADVEAGRVFSSQEVRNQVRKWK